MGDSDFSLDSSQPNIRSDYLMRNFYSTLATSQPNISTSDYLNGNFYSSLATSQPDISTLHVVESMECPQVQSKSAYSVLIQRSTVNTCNDDNRLTFDTSSRGHFEPFLESRIKTFPRDKRSRHILPYPPSWTRPPENDPLRHLSERKEYERDATASGL